MGVGIGWESGSDWSRMRTRGMRMGVEWELLGVEPGA
jgi:hypothetical protein